MAGERRKEIMEASLDKKLFIAHDAKTTARGEMGVWSP